MTICTGCYRGVLDCECISEEDVRREEGYYRVEMPWGDPVIAYWGTNGGQDKAWWLVGHPHEHETNYFNSIGDMIQL